MNKWQLRSRGVTAVMGALLVAGCGSTVSGSAAQQESLGPGSVSQGATQGASGLSAPTGVGSASSVATGGGSVTGLTGQQGSSSAGATGQASSGGVSPAASGMGYDAHHIYLGIGTSNDASSYAQSLGFNVNVGDTKGQAQALINYLNRHGGIGGRTIVPVWHDINSANYNTDPSGTAQSECADWTQDHHVFAAINALSYPDNAIACLAHAHTIAITSAPAGPIVTASLLKYSPYFYAPGMADTGHLAGPFIDELVAEHYFTGWDTTAGAPGSAPVRIGVLYAADRPDLLTLTKQALARHGMTVTDSFYLSSTSDDSQIPSAILRFKAEGITHVLTYGFLSVVPTIAEDQHYRPRYGVSSWDGFALAASSGSSQQFNGALGVGWTPLEDVDAAHDPGEGSAEKQCASIMQAGGQDPSNRTTAAVMAADCEQFLLLRDAVSASGLLSVAGMDGGVTALGTGFGSALTFGERFAQDRHAGVAALRPVRFDNGCTCFDYSGPVVKFS